MLAVFWLKFLLRILFLWCYNLQDFIKIVWLPLAALNINGLKPMQTMRLVPKFHGMYTCKWPSHIQNILQKRRWFTKHIKWSIGSIFYENQLIKNFLHQKIKNRQHCWVILKPWHFQKPIFGWLKLIGDFIERIPYLNWNYSPIS